MSTQVHPSSTAQSTTKPATVIVGVDGSAGNRAAVTWAHHEAEDLGGRLVLVGATHEYSPPTPRFSVDASEECFRADTKRTLERVRDALRASEAEVPILVGSGGALSVLLTAAEQADVLVVGKRGLGAVKRMIVGSNSVAVAGRSSIPVVVVPDLWKPVERLSVPVVVGLDGSTRDEAVLTYAFVRAVRLAVPLVVVYGWQVPGVHSWSPKDIGRWGDEAKTHVEQALRPWVARYPEVEVATLAKDANAAMVILDAAAAAQLVVLGRHTRPRHFGGFHLGSTTRAVLHCAECPVAIIPSKTAHADVDEADHAPDVVLPLY
ncbi:MAG: universal stress protein [Nocardioidaceae bacterium]